MGLDLAPMADTCCGNVIKKVFANQPDDAVNIHHQCFKCPDLPENTWRLFYLANNSTWFTMITVVTRPTFKTYHVALDQDDPFVPMKNFNGTTETIWGYVDIDLTGAKNADVTFSRSKQAGKINDYAVHRIPSENFDKVRRKAWVIYQGSEYADQTLWINPTDLLASHPSLNPQVGRWNLNGTGDLMRAYDANQYRMKNR
ncbi:hypothetical protein SAMD00019534_008830 [Acytostelium subglobosum LB1]|uniref:hypothetical protein n=1 Tax=Acytostelium subglobosum LB1 TaxID=1410327 RepID=UPI000644B095|nr:hypothetical protein SAMD00019534_008830 [Acytostelium subglobosum LB1]GAM17708.1 hypothetical protein SAMD00019534_008830 [Acytostelium subglobosum LB1]|eukprot:XP_012758304.1 hypothetical protein SAMD00019534_008830 [Acytostelium subglobosum LB1]